MPLQLRLRLLLKRFPMRLALATLLFFVLSLSWGVTANSLPLAAKVAGWDWQPMTSRPLVWLSTLPLRVLPAGWIYGGSVGLEIPPEILYYSSSGRRITGWQMIATVKGDDGKTGEHYLVLERKVQGVDEGVDFDRVKVLAYDPESRDHYKEFSEDVMGRFPITLKMAGTRGQFQLIKIDKTNPFPVDQYLFRIKGSVGGHSRLRRVEDCQAFQSFEKGKHRALKMW